MPSLQSMSTFPDTFLYSISWEDVNADKPVMNIQPTDRVLTLTGGGDNVFQWMLEGAKRVDCVDINPAQYHLMELKLKAVQHIQHYDTWWEMFGEGVCHEFDHVLRALEPYMDPMSYEFWCLKRAYFTTKGLYFCGSMGKVVSFVNKLGLRYLFTNNIQNKDILGYDMLIGFLRNVLLRLVCFVFGNTWFMWRLFGAPPKQMEMIPDVYAYVDQALTPVIEHTDIKNDNFYYYLILNGRFSKSNCPDYLKERNFVYLKEYSNQVIRNHNDSFINVLGRSIYDKVILMDHLDWTEHEYVQTLCDTLRYHMQYSENSLTTLRSASRDPWYIDVFRRNGFVATRVSEQRPNTCMDRVNTYVSFWVITHNIAKKNV